MEIGSLGVPELLIILVVVLLLFGPRRLPEVARGLGKAVHDFRSGLQNGLEDLREEARAPSAASAPPPSETVQAPAPAPSAGTAATPAEEAGGGGSTAAERDY